MDLMENYGSFKSVMHVINSVHQLGDLVMHNTAHLKATELAGVSRWGVTHHFWEPKRIEFKINKEILHDTSSKSVSVAFLWTRVQAS